MALKLGQKIQRSTVPIMAKMSDVYLEFSSFSAKLKFLFLCTKEMARPKYAPNVWMKIAPPCDKILSERQEISMLSTTKPTYIHGAEHGVPDVRVRSEKSSLDDGHHENLKGIQFAQ